MQSRRHIAWNVSTSVFIETRLDKPTYTEMFQHGVLCGVKSYSLPKSCLAYPNCAVV